ncbi:hypothetical protein DENSPDRAFT_420872 [Dentipellis sp. KUC8613]|nr:hypothetical protein DENSPDRAFT_420872 [Dentipellis sp. KUC8613]
MVSNMVNQRHDKCNRGARVIVLVLRRGHVSVQPLRMHGKVQENRNQRTHAQLAYVCSGPLRTRRRSVPETRTASAYVGPPNVGPVGDGAAFWISDEKPVGGEGYVVLGSEVVAEPRRVKGGRVSGALSQRKTIDEGLRSSWAKGFRQAERSWTRTY